MNKEYLAFETERLIIRPTTEIDAAFILELMNSPKWIQNIGDRKLNTIEDAAAYIKNKMLPQLEKLGYSNYTVVRKSDGAKLGTCGLYDREGLEGLDIGFAFLPQFERKGYAFESANSLMEAAKTDFEITLISGITTRENVGSQKLLEKLGLVFQKMIRIPNDDEDLMLFQWKK